MPYPEIDSESAWLTEIISNHSGGGPILVLQIIVVTEMIYGWDSTQWSETALMEMKIVD